MTDWTLISFVTASTTRLEVMRCLAKLTQTPKDLSMALDIHISHISRALSELSKKGLVQCMNPKDKKWKYFALTEKGKSLLEEITALRK